MSKQNFSAAKPSASNDLRIIHGDNLVVLPSVADLSIALIYIDPPFNTGKDQKRVRIRTIKDEDGDRIGFQGQRYRTVNLSEACYSDAFGDRYLDFLEPRLCEAYRTLRDDGSLFFHIDSKEVHYCKVLLDQIFGRSSFMNEIIWSYDYGGRSKRRWPAKHDNILWYAKDPKRYTFNYEAMDRIPYMAPGLVGAEKARRGKTPTDVWWHTIVPTNSRERTAYPTQKPIGLLERIVKVHSRPGDRLLDFFAGSGTFGEAAAKHGRNCTLIDENPVAIRIMKKRLAHYNPVVEKAKRRR
ncbi:DNA-methyltransferase [Thioalkalivibrio sp. HK1]|uniref:DNA-methyltransferase n=1 Tax=Thioalkalivibrio sp. HK1 TaxID=1469245 RepID=UPI0004B310CC|nr:site-specific DNA-methyltransferase [Thioalkalivibrio sp. HK1]